MTAKDIYKDWCAWLVVDKSARTVEDYSKIVTHYLNDEKVTSLDKVTPIALSKWINKKGRSGYNRRKLVLSVLKMYFRYAHDMGYASRNPAAVVTVKTDNLTHKQKETKKVEAINDDDVRQLIACLDKEIIELTESHKDDVRVGSQYRGDRRYQRQKSLERSINYNRFWKAAILLSYETGLRLSDICQLEWDCIEDDQLVVHTDKRDKRVAIPMWAEVRAAINAIPDDHDDELYCFPVQYELYHSPKRVYLSQEFVRILKRSGVHRNGLSFHSLRHGCLTKWKSGGMDLEHIQKLAGHSSAETTEGYIHNGTDARD
jgi:integrase